MDLAAATEVTGQGLTRLPMELQVSAAFLKDTVDYLTTGVQDITLEKFVDQVSPAPICRTTSTSVLILPLIWLPLGPDGVCCFE